MLAGESLQVLGIGLTAAYGAFAAAVLIPYDGWVYGPYRKRLIAARTTWFSLVLIFTIACSFAAGLLFLPPSIPLFTGFVAMSVLWWAVAATCVHLLDAKLALITPLILVLLHLTKLIPWNYNLLFNMNLTNIRLWITLVFLCFALFAYVIPLRPLMRVKRYLSPQHQP